MHSRYKNEEGRNVTNVFVRDSIRGILRSVTGNWGTGTEGNSVSIIASSVWPIDSIWPCRPIYQIFKTSFSSVEFSMQNRRNYSRERREWRDHQQHFLVQVIYRPAVKRNNNEWIGVRESDKEHVQNAYFFLSFFHLRITLNLIRLHTWLGESVPPLCPPSIFFSPLPWPHYTTTRKLMGGDRYFEQRSTLYLPWDV